MPDKNTSQCFINGFAFRAIVGSVERDLDTWKEERATGESPSMKRAIGQLIRVRQLYAVCVTPELDNVISKEVFHITEGIRKNNWAEVDRGLNGLHSQIVEW